MYEWYFHDIYYIPILQCIFGFSVLHLLVQIIYTI